MAEKGLDAFVLRRNPNLAWAIAGRAHVPTTIDAACFDLIITKDSAVAITNVVEAPRLSAEEFPAEVSVQTVPWSQGRDSLLPTGAKVGSDQPGGDRIDLGVEVEIDALQRSCTERELEDPAALVRIRAHLLRRIQIVTGEGRVRDLLISEFVLN